MNIGATRSDLRYMYRGPPPELSDISPADNITRSEFLQMNCGITISRQPEEPACIIYARYRTTEGMICDTALQQIPRAGRPNLTIAPDGIAMCCQTLGTSQKTFWGTSWTASLYARGQVTEIESLLL